MLLCWRVGFVPSAVVIATAVSACNLSSIAADSLTRYTTVAIQYMYGIAFSCLKLSVFWFIGKRRVTNRLEY